MKAGVLAGTAKKKLVVWFRPIVPVFVTVKLFVAVNVSAATTVFSVWYSIPGVFGSSRLRIAEWIPDVVGLTVTSSVAGAFLPSEIEPAELNVPSFPTQFRL